MAAVACWTPASSSSHDGGGGAGCCCCAMLSSAAAWGAHGPYPPQFGVAAATSWLVMQGSAGKHDAAHSVDAVWQRAARSLGAGGTLAPSATAKKQRASIKAQSTVALKSQDDIVGVHKAAVKCSAL